MVLGATRRGECFDETTDYCVIRSSINQLAHDVRGWNVNVSVDYKGFAAERTLAKPVAPEFQTTF
jgi:hypothetical protein